MKPHFRLKFADWIFAMQNKKVESLFNRVHREEVSHIQQEIIAAKKQVNRLVLLWRSFFGFKNFSNVALTG